MSLRGGLFSRLGYLSAGCGDNGVPEGMAPSKASTNDDSGVTSVVSCSPTSPASGTPRASDVLVVQKDSTLHSSLRLGNLGSTVRNYYLPRPPKSLKTRSREHSSNGPCGQIVFDPHSGLGKCGDLSLSDPSGHPPFNATPPITN